eukprot:TRINITY_DN6330_c0_g1_i2.p2 TRINITY_DN6330_c0_g1~~TRINITY_DN6330_c0_g1_i2.p2  ORF type:complete len:199 (+),score=65.81 TRINITY_DN6330_c0_g1_i2:674-1270(+)
MTSTENDDACSMMDKYLATVWADENMAALSPSSDKKKKSHISNLNLHLGNLLPHKRKEFNDITNSNSSPVKTPSSPAKSNSTKVKKTKSVTSTPIKEESSHIFNSLTSPAKDFLMKKKKRELEKEVALLTERVNALETTQVELHSEMVKIQDRSKEITTERDDLKKKNEELLKEIATLREENNRRNTSNWKSFLSNGN